MRDLNIAELEAGLIVHHQPRNTFYRILGPTKIKTHCGNWVDGFAYQEVKKYGNHTFLSIDSSTIYTRPKELFDSDWKVLGSFQAVPSKCQAGFVLALAFGVILKH